MARKIYDIEFSAILLQMATSTSVTLCSTSSFKLMAPEKYYILYTGLHCSICNCMVVQSLNLSFIYLFFHPPPPPPSGLRPPLPSLVTTVAREARCFVLVKANAPHRLVVWYILHAYGYYNACHSSSACTTAAIQIKGTASGVKAIHCSCIFIP